LADRVDLAQQMPKASPTWSFGHAVLGYRTDLAKRHMIDATARSSRIRAREAASTMRKKSSSTLFGCRQLRRQPSSSQPAEWCIPLL